MTQAVLKVGGAAADGNTAGIAVSLASQLAATAQDEDAVVTVMLPVKKLVPLNNIVPAPLLIKPVAFWELLLLNKLPETIRSGLKGLVREPPAVLLTTNPIW